MSDRAMRPFWIHQFAEYLIGIALIAQGLQERHPLVPVLAGTAVLANAAIARGPLGAFKWVARGLHRWLDLVVMVGILVVAAQPWFEVPAGGRLIMLVMLVPLGFLWFYTDWAERRSRTERRLERASVRSEDVGRSAGRLAGNAVKAIKKKTK